MSFLRQLDVVDQYRLAETPITIIGAGAIGSFTALALAKSGAENLTVYDFDTVESHNLPNQWYRPSDVGRLKVDALGELVEQMTGVGLTCLPHRFEDQPVTEVTICAVDSMDTRISLWDGFEPKPELYVDARMGAEVGRVFCVGRFSGWYEETLYPSSEALQAPCTARATMYCASGLAAFITAQVVQYTAHRPTKAELTVDFRNALVI